MLIYVLIDPRDNEIRYVGKTLSLAQRHKEHKCIPPANDRSYRAKWIRKLHRLGLLKQLTITLVQEIDSKNVDGAEKYWISYFRSIGCRLVNTQEGGTGGSNGPASEETKQKMSLAHSTSIKVTQQLEQLHASNIGRPTSTETKQKLSNRRKQTKAIHSAIGRELWESGVLSNEKCRPRVLTSCVCCQRQFDSLIALATHLSNVQEKNAGPYQCLSCDKQCTTQRALKSHVTWEHSYPPRPNSRRSPHRQSAQA